MKIITGKFKKLKIEDLKIWLLGGLLAVSLLTQFSWLSYPAQVVFDEVHFGKFATAYCCTKERFFDIHPPHAKLLIGGAAWLGGYRGDFEFNNIGQAYPEHVPVFALRFFPALAGAVLPLIFFFLLRQLGASFGGAILGGFIIALDNAITVQTRMISLDGILLAATFGAISAVLAAEKKNNWLGAVLFSLAGLLAGLAAGVKFTGLAALGVLGVFVIVRICQNLRTKQWINWIVYGMLILVSAIFVYAGGWWLHFSILSLPGSGDAWHVPTGNFIEDTKIMHEKMLGANYNLGATHPYSSAWWEWPIMKRPIFYWQSNGAMIYLLGNPAVWWGGGILFIIVLGKLLFAENGRRLFQRLWIPLLGFSIALLPLIRVPRVLFMYHYLTPLIFSLLVGLLWFDGYLEAGKRKNRSKIIITYSSVLAVVLLCFIVFSPVTYGIPVSEWLKKVIFIFPGWR